MFQPCSSTSNEFEIYLRSIVYTRDLYTIVVYPAGTIDFNSIDHRAPTYCYLSEIKKTKYLKEQITVALKFALSKLRKKFRGFTSLARAARPES
jgi:hypothetical protein